MIEPRIEPDGWVPYNERRQIEKKVFDAFRNCITEPKCKDCPWEQCEQFNQKKVEIPFTLALDVLNLLKEQEAQKFFVDGSGKITPLPVVVRCKDCKHWYFADNRIQSEQENVCGRNGIVVTPDWFCADGERK